MFRPDDRHANPAIADTLEQIAAGRFYQGPLAQAIADASWLSPGDLAEHENRWVDPVEFAYRDHVLLEMPPPGQGSIAGWALESLASPAPRDQVAALVDAYARGYATIGGTAYVCAADGDGMAVSLIQSIFYGFGSQVIVPGRGFMLQNRGSGFAGARSSERVRARQAAVPHDHPGRPAGRRRPLGGGVRGDGRAVSAAGPRAGAGQPAQSRHAAAGRAGRAPLPAGGRRQRLALRRR